MDVINRHWEPLSYGTKAVKVILLSEIFIFIGKNDVGFGANPRTAWWLINAVCGLAKAAVTQHTDIKLRNGS